MKKLTCEMCGGTDLVKQDGLFVCQHCGAKYSIDEAKKMMVEDTVEVTGTVKIDSSEILEKSLKNARRAKDDNNIELAEKYYEEVIDSDPENWEAIFYNTYFKAMQYKFDDTILAADSVTNCIDTTLELLRNNVASKEYDTALLELSDNISAIVSRLYKGVTDVHQHIDKAYTDGDETELKVLAVIMMDFAFADKTIEYFGETEIAKGIAVRHYENGLYIIQKYLIVRSDGRDLTMFSKGPHWKTTYVDKLKKYKPNYQLPPMASTPNVCYVATAVYGSYDCPQVWTLRRFRDYTLAETSYGRAFVRFYYAVSPTLVKWLGNTAWFKRICRTPLDMLVKRLQAGGVENTPYEDRPC
jgi:uncharacterized Zn finger protein (UPF0148 family)